MKFFHLHNQYLIIATIIATIVISMLSLAYTEMRQQKQSEDYWSIYFVEPLDQASHDFVIDNHTHNTEFTYAITMNDQTLKSETITVMPDSQAYIKVEDAYNQPHVSITVKTDDQKKSIYKN